MGFRSAAEFQRRPELRAAPRRDSVSPKRPLPPGPNETMVAMKFAFPMPHMMELKALTQPWEFSVTGADQTVMAKRAEELGYDMLAVPEHFVVPHTHVELSGPHYFHSTVAQAYLAGATSASGELRCHTAAAATSRHHGESLGDSGLDERRSHHVHIRHRMGRGRVQDPRGSLSRARTMADEYLAAIIELWTSEAPSFHGKYVSFDNVAFEPKPVQKPHPPIWIGGDADAQLKRAARFASGWFPFLTQPEEFPAKIDFIKSQPTYNGGPFEVCYGLGTSLIGKAMW